MASRHPFSWIGTSSCSSFRLRQGEVENRTADQIIADQHPGEDMAPLNAEDPAGNLRDRRIGMIRLDHGQSLDFERQTWREGRLAHRKAIPLHMRIELPFDEARQGSVDHDQPRCDQEDQDANDDPRPFEERGDGTDSGWRGPRLKCFHGALVLTCWLRLTPYHGVEYTMGRGEPQTGLFPSRRVAGNREN